MIDGRIVKAIDWCFTYRHHLDAEDIPLVEMLYGKWRKYGGRMWITAEQLEHLRRCYKKIPPRADLAMGPRTR